MLDAGGDEWTLDKEDIRYIKNVFKLDGMMVEDVMTPKMRVSCIPDTISDDKIMEEIQTKNYSRISVYSGDVDNIIGILYTREFLLNRELPWFELSQILKPPMFVSKTKRLDLLFKEMQKMHTHIAILIDRYEMTSGIVTMEDILEELVGKIWDEKDKPIELIYKENDTTYHINTSISIDNFFDFFNLSPDDTSESTTVNGWIIEKCNKIPCEG